MPEKIITLYCFFDDLLKALGHQDDFQAQVSTAEIMTVAAVAVEFFTGNHQKSLDFLTSHHYIKAFSKSRFNRRLHRIPETLWQFSLALLAQIHKRTKTFIVDTFPVPVCRNIRIKRCKIYKGEEYRGYIASKKEYFYGLKVCLIVAASGCTVELVFAPGSTADIDILRSMDFELPGQSALIGDKGFLDRSLETDLKQDANIYLIVPRRSNMKEQLDDLVQWVAGSMRKRVETTFSQLAERLARSVHAVTARGFELKIFLTVLTYSLLG
ncbi:MAG: IS982 family transposase [Pedobacter sp.]|nr:MAG: IS982 family transposase [Pedobacter sp.]